MILCDEKLTLKAVIIRHIHDALRQVDAMRRLIADRQRFYGYSGRARALGGGIALFAGLGASGFGNSGMVHPHFLTVWGGVFVIAALLNYGALFHWFFTEEGANRDWRRLRPAVEILPVWAVGGLISFALIRAEELDLLYGAWMALYSLAQFQGRRGLPANQGWVGAWYAFAGTGCVIFSDGLFAQPWVMGLVFGMGEIWGGWLLHLHRLGRTVSMTAEKEVSP